MTDLNFFDPEVQKCPYDAYQHLRDEHPVYQDPATGMFHVTRYEDVRHILANHDTFSGNVRGKAPTERQLKVVERFKEKGWVPCNTHGSRRARPQTNAQHVQRGISTRQN